MEKIWDLQSIEELETAAEHDTKYAEKLVQLAHTVVEQVTSAVVPYLEEISISAAALRQS